MCIGGQSKYGGEIAQHTEDGLNIHAVLECDGGESVAEIMESDLWDELSGTGPGTD